MRKKCNKYQLSLFAKWKLTLGTNQIRGMSNVRQPTFASLSSLQGIITPDKYTLSKCFIPRESTVIALYIMAALSVLLANMRLVYIHLKSRGKRTKIMVDCCVR